MANNVSDIRIVPFSKELIPSFNQAVGHVAKERRYLAATRPFSLEETEAFVSMIREVNAVQFFALNPRGRVVGWCDIIPKPFEGMRHVGTLGMGVLKDYRGRGIGSGLLRMSLAEAVLRGLKKVELEVFSSNNVAVKLYHSAGFTQEGIRRHAREIDGELEDIVLMGLELQPPA